MYGQFVFFRKKCWKAIPHPYHVPLLFLHVETFETIITIVVSDVFFLHPYTWEMIQFWRAYFAAMNPSDASPFRHMSIPSNLKRIKRKPWELKKPFMKDVFFWKDYDFSGLFYRSLTYRVHVGVPFSMQCILMRLLLSLIRKFTAWWRVVGWNPAPGICTPWSQVDHGKTYHLFGLFGFIAINFSGGKS